MVLGLVGAASAHCGSFLEKYFTLMVLLVPGKPLVVYGCINILGLS